MLAIVYCPPSHAVLPACQLKRNTFAEKMPNKLQIEKDVLAKRGTNQVIVNTEDRI